MELFYSQSCNENSCTLVDDESKHCIKVLRHKEGDTINIIDGLGSMYECCIEQCSANKTIAKVISKIANYGTHPYKLTMAVAPPKNIERFEWFVEKATEIGLDEIYPVIGDFSERKILKTDRLDRIILSACKQSLKAQIPNLHPAQSVTDFLELSREFDKDCKKVICYCSDINSASKKLISDLVANSHNIAVLIGPEGDFSEKEVMLALECGWEIASLGNSRLRIETAALTAVGVVYFLNN